MGADVGLIPDSTMLSKALWSERRTYIDAQAAVKRRIWRNIDAWTWWIVGLFGCPASCCLSCVRAPWTWGLFMCFCALFSLLNVEEVYNEHSPCCNCNAFDV